MYCLRQRWTHFHLTVFILTFMGYALFHSARKSFSNIKDVISDEWTPTFQNSSIPEKRPYAIWNSRHLFNNKDTAEIFLGTLDSVFLFSYAIGLFINGVIGDRLDMRKVLSVGMIGSGISIILFGCVSDWTKFFSKPYYIAFWILNGLLQSTGWPACVAIMGYWIGKHSRGLILGLWSGCASVGNILGALFVTSVLDYGYSYALLIPASVLIAGGIIIFFGLIVRPQDVKIEDPDLPQIRNDSLEPDSVSEIEEPLLNSDIDDVSENNLSSDSNDSRRAITIWKAILLPGVIPYSLAYGCLKFVNYAFFFWLPFYLTSAFGWSDKVSDQLSIWYDVGGIIFGTIFGFLTDLSGRRAPALLFLLVMSMPMLYIYSIAPADKKINAVIMTFLGGFIGGPSNLISAAISADLGRQCNSNERALSTVTGIVDGTGSMGAAIGQVLVPVIHQSLGWHATFNSFIIMVGLTLLCISPIIFRDFKENGMRCCSKPPEEEQTLIDSS